MLEDFTEEQLELLLQMAVPPQPPYLLAGIGFLISLLCGLTFGRLVQTKPRGLRSSLSRRWKGVPVDERESPRSVAGQSFDFEDVP